MEAVQKVGLNQIGPVDGVVFAEHENWKEKFQRRLSVLKNSEIDN